MPEELIPQPHGGKLRRIPKGVSGNPNGRPKRIPELDKLMAEVMGEEKDGVSAMEVILKALRAKAAKGDIRAAEVILNYGYGKPKQQVDHTSSDGSLKPPTINVLNVPTDEV